MQQPKHPLLRRGLDHLNNLPQIKAVYVVDEPYTSDRLIADGKLVLHSPQGEVEYIVEIKSNVTLQTLESVLQQLKLYQERLEPGQRMLLVGDRLSQSVVEQLIKEQVEFIDVNGTTYLNNPLLYVLLYGEISKPKTAPNFKIGSTHLKIIYGILQQPELLETAPGQITELAGLKGESHVLRRIRELSNFGYLDRLPDQKFRVNDYVGLLERWEIGYAETLRNYLFIDSFRPASKQQLSTVLENAVDLVTSNSLFDASEQRVLMGGELGAAIATEYLQPIRAVFHLPDETSPQQLALKLRLMPDPGGAIVFLRQISPHDAWKNSDYAYLANPLLIHAELSLNTDERVQETARRLFDRYLAQRAA